MPTGLTTSPVRNDRKRLRRSKYSSPFRRARPDLLRSAGMALPPQQGVDHVQGAAKDDGAGRVSAQQFQPPSGIWSATSRCTTGSTSTPR